MRWLNYAVAVLLSASLSAATFPANRPSTTNNDDGCDISLLPAATLLLPYFEVDLDSGAGNGETTIFTITNTYELPQAVRVTLWTDYALPVISFSIYLTGYDVQSINLYDVIFRGAIAPQDGTGSDVSPTGELSGTNAVTDFDNPLLDESSCRDLPINLPSLFTQRMRSAFTAGVLPASGQVAACTNIGGVHANAVGYATIDVMGSCANLMPIDAAYFGSEIRYDNVLIGDYIQVDGAGNHAQVNTMVHIRAIPEGGTRAAATPTNLPRTFYSRFQPAASATADRRQPLPSVFAARWITAGTSGFQTHFKIWREGQTASNAGCASYPLNAAMNLVEIVRFDEEENPETLASDVIEDVFPDLEPLIPATSRLHVDDFAVFPTNSQESVGGWMYLNLDNARETNAKQNWVVVAMRAEERFSGDFDAQAFGNGCSGRMTQQSNAYGGQRPIGPLPDTTP